MRQNEPQNVTIGMLEAAHVARNELGRQIKVMEEVLASARESFHTSQFGRCRNQLDKLSDVVDSAKKLLTP